MSQRHLSISKAVARQLRDLNKEAVAEVGPEGNGADPQIVYVSRFDLL